MGKILLKTLLAFVLLLGLNESYATHIVGGTLEYVRLGPGSLPNSSRYKIVLRLWKDASNITPTPANSFNNNIVIECRGDTLGYTAASFDDYSTTFAGGNTYPYGGLFRMMDPSIGFGNNSTNLYGRAKREFIRDFQISNRSAVDTQTVVTGAISNSNANNNTSLPSKTKLPGYENPFYVAGSYPNAQYMSNSYGYYRGWPVDASGNPQASYGGYTATAPCANGRLCVTSYIDSCTFAPSYVFTQYLEYIRVVDLPNIPGGYHLRYSFRARASKLLNVISYQTILDSTGTSSVNYNQGYSVYARIPDIAQLDNSVHYVASTVPGFWTGASTTLAGFSSGYINNLGCSPAIVTVVGLANAFNRPVYTAYSTTVMGTSLPAGFTVVGVPASLKQLYIESGINILTGTGINNPQGYPSQIVGLVPSTVADRVRNSSPKFSSVPPLFVCQYQPSSVTLQNPVFDHSASDLDNDSIGYEFAHPLDGGSLGDGAPYTNTVGDAMFIGTWTGASAFINGKTFNYGDPLYATTPYGTYPQSVNIATQNYIKYYHSYTYDSPMGTNSYLSPPNNQAIQLDPVLGKLTIQPTVPLGLYVVSIKAKEFRRMADGTRRFLGEVARDYMFNMLSCPLPAQALTTTTSSCGSTSTYLANSSTDASTSFYWDSGKDRYIMTTSIVGANTFTGIKRNLSRIINTTVVGIDAQTSNTVVQMRSVVGGNLTPKNDAYFDFSVAGTYFVKLVVQPRGGKCTDSVYQKVVVSTIAAGWFPTKAGTVCVNSAITFSSYISTISGTTISGSGITTISGSSLWTDPLTNPIPMRPYTTIVGATTISGFTNYKWMVGNSSATSYTPPSPAEPSKLTHITWDFGDGTIQELTFNGSNFVAYPSLKNNVAIVYTIPGGPLSIPGVNYVYTTTGGVSSKTYSVIQTVENQFGCTNSLTRNVTVIQAQPTASVIGANVCQNNSVVTVSGFITVATGGIWSGGTGAYLPGTTMTGTSLSLQYKPTSLEIASVGNIIPIKLTTNGNGVCQAGLSSTIGGVTVIAKPVVVAGNSFTVCGNNLSYTLSGSVTGGTFTGLWMTKGTGTFTGSQMSTSTILGDTYLISKADSITGKVKLILTSANNGICSAVSDSLTLTISPLSAQPKASAGSDFTVCSNNSNILLNGVLTNVSTGGGVWSAVNTTASGTFGAGNLPTTTTLSGSNAFYTPSTADTTAGFVNLVLQTTIPVSNGGCKNVSDTVKVTILPSPKLSIDIKSNIPLKPYNACANNAVFTFTGTISGAGGGIWQITNPLGSGTFLPSSNPSVVAIGANINKSTVVYFPSPQEIAAANNSNSPGYDLGVRLVSTVNGFCNSVKSGNIISLIPAPSVTISGVSPLSVCKNNSIINLTSSTFFAPDIAWFSSSSGSFSGGNFIPNPSYISSSTDTSNGNVQIILSGTSIADNCKTVYDTLIVNYTNLPTLNAGSNQFICENNLVAQLNGSVTAPASGGIWSTYGTGSFNSSGTKTSGVLNDKYFLSVTDLSNGSVTLGLTTTGVNIGTATGQCLPVSKNTTLTITAKPSINFSVPDTVNQNNASVDLTVTIVGVNVTPGTSAVWSGGSGSYSPNATNFTYYSTSPLGPILIGKLTYIPSAAEILAKQVTLNVSVTGANNCAPVTNSLQFNIYPKPTVTIFNKGASVCANNALINLTGTVTGAAGGTWSGGSNPVIFSAPGFNASYTPTSAEINAGSVKLYFTTTGEYNNAKPERDSITISITPSPIVKTGGNVVICGNGLSTTISGTIANALGGVWTTSGSGSFTIGSIAGAAMNNTYFPSASDRISATPIKLTLTSVGNGGCIAVNDVMNLSFSATPTANAGPGQTVCVNDFPVQLNANGSSGSWSSSRTGGVFASTGNATSTSLIDTYTPTTIPGIITLTWTTSTAGCQPVASNMLLTVVSAPVVNIGPAVTVCGSNKFVALIATVTGASSGVWRSSGTGNFTTTGSQIGSGTSDTYILSTADINNGQVTLTFTGSGTSPCSPVSATKTITITPDITVNAGPDQIFCAGSTTNITLAGQVLANGNVNTLLGGTWSQTATVTGSYIGSKNVLNAVFTPSFNDKNVSGKVALIFTASASGACLSPKPDTIIYNFTPSPIATIPGGDFSICSDAGSISLNATYSGAAGIIWSTTGTNLAGNWSLSKTNTSVQYIYSQNEINAGKVSFIVQTNGSGVCANALSNIVNVTILGKPAVTAGPDINVCSNAASFSLTGANMTVSGSAMPLVYWFSSSPTLTGGTFNNNTIIGINGAGNNPVYTPTASEIAGGTITLFISVTGPGSCNSQLLKRVITFTPAPTVNISSPIQTFCSNTSVLTLTGSTTSSASGRWTITTPGATGNSNIASITSTSATYTLLAADRNLSVLGFVFTTTLAGCNPVSTTKTINLSPAPMVQITQITPISGLKSLTFCGDAMTATFTGINTTTGAGLWSSNPTGTFSLNSATLPKVVFAPLSSDIKSAYTNKTPIKLYLTSDNNGVCAPVKDSVSVFYTTPPKLSAGADTIVCSNTGTISLTGISRSSNIVSVKWTTSANSTFTGGMGTFLGSNLNISTLFNESYVPGAAEKAAGSTILMLISTSVTGGCMPVSSQKNINYIKAPSINPMSDQTVCANNSAVNCVAVASNYSGGYWTRSGVGQFASDSTLPNATYYPLGSDLVSGTTGIQVTFNALGLAPCPIASKSFTLRVTTAPTLNVTVPGSICADAGTVNLYSMVGLSTSGVSWSNISSPGTLSGKFFSNSFVLNPQYTPSANDISNGYAVFNLSTTGNGTCKAAVTTVQMSIIAKPVIVTSPDQNICASSAYGSQMKLVFTGTGFTTGQWTSNGTGSLPISQGTLGNYVYYNVSNNDIDVKKKVTFIVISVDQGQCNAVSTKYTVSFTGAPVIYPGVDNKTYCSNVGVITLSGSITGADSYQYQWIPNDHALEYGTLTGTSINSISTNGLITTVGIMNTFLLGNGHNHGEGNFGFNLIVTSSGVCNAVYNTGLNANLEFIPEFILSGDPQYCEDASKINLAATWLSQSSNLDFIWSGYDGITTTGSSLSSSQFSPSIFDQNVSFFFANADRTVSGVTFVVSTTGVSYCPVQTQSLQIPIRKKSLITATGTALVCSNQPVVTLTGFSNSGKGIWIANSVSSNAGTFTGVANHIGSVSGVSGSMTTYTISGTEISNGFVKFIYQSDNNGVCSATSSTVGVNINQAPVVDAGNDFGICPFVPVTLTGTVSPPVTIAGGTFWSVASLPAGSSVSASTSTINTTLGANVQNVQSIFSASTISGVNSAVVILNASLPGCNLVTSSAVLTFVPGASFDVGTYPNPICASDKIQLKPGVTSPQGQWSTTASGYFLTSGTNTTTKMDDIFVPNVTVSGAVVFVLSSLPGTGACGSPAPAIAVITITNGMIATAGNSLRVSVCLGYNPIFVGTLSGTSLGRWFTGGTGVFSSSGTDSTDLSNAIVTTSAGFTTVEDRYLPSDQDKQSGKVILTFEALNDGSNNCLTPVRDTLTISFTNKPKSISKSYSRLCGNVASQNGITITGVVRLFTPNDNSPFTVHDNGARWRLLNPSTVLGLSSNHAPTGFVLTSTGPSVGTGNIFADDTPQAFSSYTSTSVTGFQEITINAVYYPSDYDLTRQYFDASLHTDTLAMIIESAELANSTQITTLTGTSFCDPALDTLKIIFDKSPTASITGANNMICADQDEIVLKGIKTLAFGGIWSQSGGSGQFLPDSAYPTVTYKLSASDKSNSTSLGITFNYQTTGNGSCYPAQTNYVLTVNPKPNIMVSSDLIVCADSPVITVTGTITGTSVAAYQWITNGSNTLSGYNVNSITGLVQVATSYSISPTDISFGNIQFTFNTSGPGSCIDLNKVINVDINPLPTITPSPDIDICKDIDNISLSVTTENVSTVQWAVLLNGVTSTPGVGTFTGNGLIATASLAGNNLLNINYKLTASDQNADSLVFYISSLGATPNTSNPACNIVTKKIVVRFTPTPTLALNTIAGICSDAASFNLQGTITGMLGVGGIWSSSGNGTFSPDERPLPSTIQTSAYTYNLSQGDKSTSMITITLAATDIGTCTKNYIETQDVTIVPLPKIGAGGDTTVCSDAKTISFNLSTQTGAASIAWKSFGNGTFTGINNTVPGVWLYNISPSDSAAGQVTFELDANGVSPCGLVSAYRVVKFYSTPAISISAGLDQVICSDNPVINLNGSTDGVGAYWSAFKYASSITGTNQQYYVIGDPNAGRGVFRNGTDASSPVDSNAINPSYFPSTEDTLGANRDNSNQVVNLKFTAYGNGSCANHAYAGYMKVTFTPRPNIYIPSIPPICDSDTRPVTILGFFLNSVAGSGLWTSTGGGQFSPGTISQNSPTVAGIIYYPDSSDRYVDRRVGIRLQPQNMGTCLKPLQDAAISLIINTSPGLNPGLNRTVCESISVVSFTGLVSGLTTAQWKSSGSGIFTSNSTSPGANLSITGNNVTDAYKPSGMDVLAAKVNFFLKSVVTTNNCPLDSAMVSLTFDRIPQVTVSSNRTICADIGVVSLTGTVTNVNGGYWTALSPASGTFVPSATLAGTSYQLSASDASQDSIQFVLISGSNQCQPVSSNPVTYYISPSPVANSGSPLVCTINGIPLHGRTSNSPFAYWKTNGTGLFSPSPYDTNALYYPSQNDINIKGKITLTLVAAGLVSCDSARSSVILNVGDNPIPKADAGRDDIVCQDGVFKLNVGHDSTAYTYVWLTNSLTGFGKQLVPIASANTLSLNVQLDKDSVFVLQVTDNNNKCLNTDSIKIRVITLPSLNLQPRVCYSDTLILPYNQIIPIVKTDGVYQWYKNGVFVQGETSPKRIKATTSGDYTLEYTEFKCSTRDTTNVRPLPLLNTKGKVICAGSQTSLTPNILTISGVNTNLYAVDWALTYNSSLNGFNLSQPSNVIDSLYHKKAIQIVESRTSAKYLVAVTDTLYGLSCVAYDTARVQTHPVPIMQLRDVSGCDNDVVTLDARPTNLQTPKIFTYPPTLQVDTVNAMYSWTSIPAGLVKTPSAPKITVTMDAAGVYFATFTIGECIAKDTANVLFNAPPVVSNQPLAKYCVEDKTGIVLDAGTGTDYKYLWLASGNTNRTELVYDTLTYYFKVFNKAGCSVLDSIEVKSLCNPKVYIPGAFIPDDSKDCSDLQNCDKYFVVRGKYFKSLKIRIYNRWGEIIFASESKDFAWDGTYNGVAQPLGVYPYVLEYESIYDDQKGVQTKRGQVTLVR